LIEPGPDSAILLAGQRINAGRALTWRLVEFLAERQELGDYAKTQAQTATESGGDHPAAMKRLCRGVKR
jgi:enoyl-CoA hydratase/carnithine racemase